jgi:sulfatase-modifying factor enzyme 1
VSDAELRGIERELSVNPISLELRRRHARLLQRSGDQERSLAALDLAWRLGAEDLFAELEELLEERAVDLGVLKLRYVPGGPFVMGIDDFDDDAAPPHLVNLSPFWVSEAPLTYGVLEGYQGEHTWFRSLAESQEGERGSYWSSRTFNLDLEGAQEVVAHLSRRHAPPDLSGRYALPSEAQWERATRAALLRPDGRNPYGLAPDEGPQWTNDHYHPRYYRVSPAYDPPGPGAGQDRVVRGILAVPPSHYAIYRDAADESGTFRVGGRSGYARAVRVEGGLSTRAVFLCR